VGIRKNNLGHQKIDAPKLTTQKQVRTIAYQEKRCMRKASRYEVTKLAGNLTAEKTSDYSRALKT